MLIPILFLRFDEDELSFFIKSQVVLHKNPVDLEVVKSISYLTDIAFIKYFFINSNSFLPLFPYFDYF